MTTHVEHRRVRGAAGELSLMLQGNEAARVVFMTH